MFWLRMILSIAASCIFLYLAYFLFKMKRDFNESIQDDRIISEQFIQRFQKQNSRRITLIIIGSVFAIVAIFLN